MAAFMKPARSVGGDFYDWFLTPDNRLIFVVADVSGKGVPAALFMAVSRTLLRSSVLSADTIEAALTSANAQLEADNDEAMFVTVFMADLNRATGRLRYVNAGHCDGWLRRKNGEMVALAASGPAVALVPNPRFFAQEVTLDPGDLLLLSSDKISEAFSPSEELYGDDRLQLALQAHQPSSAQAAVDEVARAVTVFADGAEQSDDITCLTLLRF